VSAALLGETFAHACSALQNNRLTVFAEANDLDHLFRGVHGADIVVAAASMGVALEPDMVIVPTPIKTLGAHEIVLVHAEAREVITITIARK
jgi:ribosomal protein L9